MPLQSSSTPLHCSMPGSGSPAQVPHEVPLQRCVPRLHISLAVLLEGSTKHGRSSPSLHGPVSGTAASLLGTPPSAALERPPEPPLPAEPEPPLPADEFEPALLFPLLVEPVPDLPPEPASESGSLELPSPLMQ
jgi:hypothetical protein